MKIERIELRNFRQYFGGNHRIEFSQDKTRNVTIIHGVNGAGKTSLFLALNWCLYGEGVDGIGQIISKEAMRRARHAEIVETNVTVVFHHDGKRYHASRKLTGQKRGESEIVDVPREGEFFLTRVLASGDQQKIDNPIGVMNTILPSTVRTYFFFDGEKIDTFARPEKADEVRYAVYQVLNLEVLERAKDHLEKKADELRRGLKNIASGELEKLLEQDVQAREQDRNQIKRKEELEQEIRTAQQHLTEVNQTLETYKEVEALQKQYKQYADEINSREQDLARGTERICQLASMGYVILSRQIVETALTVLDEKRQRGEIPSNVRQQFIEDLLGQQICICGRPFSEHDDAYEHLVQMMRSALPSSLENDVLETSGRLKALQDRSPELEAQLKNAMDDKATLVDLIDSLYRRQDDVKRQMRDAPQVEISQLAKQRDQYVQDIESYKAEIVRINVELEKIQARIRDLEKQIDAARKTDVKAQVLDRKMKLAQQAANAISQVYETFAENKRLEIEQQTREIFQHLAWKVEHFPDVRLTSDYQLEVIDRYGSPARPDLSAGERQVLSLSFITAMANVAQREAPLVMDTPFGRLSSAHREAITATLPSLAPQLVLFVTDEELRDQALANLEPRIGTQYRLNFNPHTSCTDIEEI